MPSYSVATTKDNLSSLIDKALAGEEVIITRHGKATVEIKVVRAPNRDPEAMRAAHERLRHQREKIPPTGITSLELKRMDQEDYEH